MPSVCFSQNIRSHVDVDVCEVVGGTVMEALDAVFADYPRLKGYLFDDDGSVRKHIAMIVNSQPVIDRLGLTDTLKPDDELFVMQALSGG